MFLGNQKVQNYREIAENVLAAFKALGCSMRLKVNFLNSHVNSFPENLGDYSEEQEQQFHEDLKVMERRYQKE